VSAAIVLSADIALTLSPMMASLVLKNPKEEQHGGLYAWSERFFDWLNSGYERLLKVSLRYRRTVMSVNVALIGVSAWLLITIPKGFFPQEDTGLIFAFTQADQDVSFQGMAERQQEVAKVILADPDVSSFGSFIGGNASAGPNTGRMYIQLKPFDQRRATVTEIIQRLRPRLAIIPGISTFLQPVQNIQVGARLARTQYQYTLMDSDPQELNEWAANYSPRSRRSLALRMSRAISKQEVRN